MYCGDETGAFVGDIGSHTARFGYGGEDCPKVVVPSAVYKHSSSVDENGKGRGSSATHRGKYKAPVSLVNAPPQSCFSSSSSDEDDCSDVGFIPIYQSMNSNNQNYKKIPQTEDDSSDGVIQDIDAWASLWEYSFSALCVRGRKKHTVGFRQEQSQPDEMMLDGPFDHPLLAVDSTSTLVSTNLREKQKALILETLFESLSAPAVYIAPSAMLSSFAYGRQTSLVVDIGHTGSRVTPVVDGYLLHSGTCKSGRGGMWLGDVQQGVLEGCWKINERNNHLVNKWNGWEGVPPCRNGGVLPRYALHPDTKQTLKTSELDQLKKSPFHSMAVHEVMYEMMTWTSQQSLFGFSSDTSTPFVGYGSSDDSDDATMEDKTDDEDDVNDDGPSYSLPDGTKIDLEQKAGKDLCRLHQLLLSDDLPTFIQPQATDTSDYASHMLPLHKLVHRSLSQIRDADLRKELSSNIILTGSASLFPGLDKSLSLELGKVLPASYKHKVISSKNTVENRYGAWIGGSILSSLGSFQQLWLSKKEYEENGAILGLQRFNNN